ncbi:GGDEF domain-containing protein [Pseudoxanthomonas sp. LjRoot125]|uniref:GGDEF domain-containing protein n=1 Tax=Pseudoxanthomonas sp. LjRoot125 TaxID=3342258 RepID=UPI003E1168DE
MRSQIPSTAGWLVLLGIALLAHALLAVSYPQQVWVTPLGACLPLGVVLSYCLGQAKGASGVLRVRWGLLAVGTGLWMLGWGMSAYSQLTGADTSVVLPYLMVFALRAIPWLLAIVLTSNRKILAHTRRFDIAQSALLTLAVCLLYFPQIAGGATFTIPLTGAHQYTYHELVNVIIAAVAVAFVPVQPTMSERHFAIGLAAMLVSYAVSALVVNHLIIGGIAPPPGSPWFLLIDVAAAVFMVHQMVLAQGTPTSDTLPVNGFRSIVVLLVPAVSPLAIILISIALADYHAVLAGSIACAALGLYVARSVLTQHAFQRAKRELEAAHAHMRWLAEHDPLTGLPNRRQLTQALNAQWDEHVKAEAPVSVMFIDIDHFKLYNDTFGHAAGDECLARVAALLQQAVGTMPQALVARYGGEEFVIVLPHTSLALAHRHAEHVREVVRHAGIAHMATASGRLSISIGIASAFPASEDPYPAGLLENADAALYAAKKRGRDQVNSQGLDGNLLPADQSV